MRTFALLMLFLNMGYLVWHQLSQPREEVEYAAVKSLFVPAEQSLVLLSELPPSPESLSTTTNVLSGVPASGLESGKTDSIMPTPIKEPIQGCEVVSGFVDQREAESFVVKTSALGVPGKVDVRQEQVSSTWWVHLPPFKSQVEAQETIDELVSKGIDNFYMRTGELAGGISLGVFSREESATTARTELLARGYETSIKEIPRYVSKTYVVLEVPDTALLETSEWQAFFATKPKLVASEKLCETIAR
jgi:hypothetical protein